MTLSARLKERRELREQQQRSMLESVPRDLNRPWEDPMAEHGERQLAMELRGVGAGGYEMPEWKKESVGAAPTFGQRSTLPIKQQRESLPIFKLRDELITAMANNQPANDARMRMQCALIDQFRSDLAKLDPLNCPAEDLYNFYCHHTRAWTATYSKIGNSLCFKPLEYVINNDKTHQNMRGYTKAQYHLFANGEETLELEDSVPYIELLRKCAQWTKEAHESRESTDHTNNEFNAPEGIEVAQ
jgi:hypothetical protein